MKSEEASMGKSADIIFLCLPKTVLGVMLSIPPCKVQVISINTIPFLCYYQDFVIFRLTSVLGSVLKGSHIFRHFFITLLYHASVEISIFGPFLQNYFVCNFIKNVKHKNLKCEI
jgi:hypothetical protein